jgi:hypothetical protein
MSYFLCLIFAPINSLNIGLNTISSSNNLFDIDDHQYRFSEILGRMLQYITNNLSQYMKPACHIINFIFS